MSRARHYIDHDRTGLIVRSFERQFFWWRWTDTEVLSALSIPASYPYFNLEIDAAEAGFVLAAAEGFASANLTKEQRLECRKALADFVTRSVSMCHVYTSEEVARELKTMTVAFAELALKIS